ncbi:3-hydroxyacyl-ACP dehydratase FabZ [Helicobacter sp. MIT 99-5507]|uniref:3-hydroxyacyl-ACP dehydratase FabZ n=1 Tax=Helicobacter sp. MIT 99-5507 TaxID=152489 RepID=UPI000E1E4060|nr:3-hydroxyacyl-ACP dehydratase FabZ [Helicobacter sp. MIT 99-5507]RDU58037.1 3-hydroxyacyl-[acyl-carrier-protein] dehydratase FabZ [Helicobacter sp. MIT 99-5507]
MIDIDRILKILPHRYPILLVDKVTSLKPFESVEAYKNITINEPIFLGHFPSKAIYPGVMIIEGMAQAGGILAFSSGYGDKVDEVDNKLVYFMSIDRAKFRSMVRPGDRLEYKLEVLKHKGKVWVLDAKAFVDGKLVAEAELKAMLGDNDDNKVKNNDQGKE